MEEKELLEKIRENVVQGRRDKDDDGLSDSPEWKSGQPGAKELLEEALAKKIDPNLLLEALTAGMWIVGEKFEKKEYFIPDMLASAETVAAAMDILEPHLDKAKIEKKGKVVLATVKGDIHDIGKNIVAIILKGAGFEVKDLGTDVSEEKIAEAIRKEKPRILGLSALLTTTMTQMRVVIEKLKEEGLRDSLRVIVGGAPLSEKFAKEIGADGYASDAFEGQRLIEKFLQKS